MIASKYLPDLPSEFIQRMKVLLADEFDEFLSSFGQFPQVSLRVNTLKISPVEFRKISPFDLAPVPGLEDAFLVKGEAQAGRHPYHAAGLYYLQDPSSMVAARLLDPQPGEMVLDISAAPGGKSTQIAGLMNGQGLLVANEIDRERVWDLVENMERCGIRNAIVTNEAPSRLVKILGGFFDRVLLDAPCSGEGMFWKSQAARQQWSQALVSSCAIRQTAILDNAAHLVKKGGRLVYATCTFEVKENEEVISTFLDRHPDFEVAENQHLPGFSSGLEQIPGGNHLDLRLKRTVRLYPHRWPGGGQYIAVFNKIGGESRQTISTGKPARLPKEVISLYQSFIQDTLRPGPWKDHLLLKGNYLYREIPQFPVLGNLHILRSGWWLGTILKNRFEPSHAMGLGIKEVDVLRIANYSYDDPALEAFLRGEPLLSDGADGWILVAVSGYPLGWGKRVKGVIKNHYPKGLRWK